MRGVALAGIAFALTACGIRLDEPPGHDSSRAGPPLAPACRLFAGLPVDFVGGRVSSVLRADGATSWIAESVRAGETLRANVGVVTAPASDPCEAGGTQPVEEIVGPSPRGPDFSVQALAPVSIDGKRWLYYALYRADPSQPFGVALEGYGVAPFDENVGRFAPTEDLLWTADRPAFGTAALVDGDGIVVYGCAGGFPAEDCFVARAPKDEIENEAAYRYYSGGGHDSPSADDASVAFKGGPPSAWRLAEGDRVVVVYVTPLGDRLVARSGLTALGPWSKPFDVARCEVPRGAFCTSPVIHGRKEASLLVSYGVASFEAGAAEASPQEFWARLAVVDLPPELP